MTTDIDCESHTTTQSQFVAQKRRQILAAGIANIGAFGLGNVLAWSSPALPSMETSGDLGDISNSKTWMASIMFVGALASSPVAGYLMNKIGRKNAMLSMAIPFILGWFLISLAYFTPSVYLIYLGRIVTGFSGAAYLVFVPVYIGEIAHSRIRGSLSTIMILMLVGGVLFTFILGMFASWFSISIICGIVPVFSLFLIPILPETPRHLISLNEPELALKSLQWLRGAETPELVKPELQMIQDSFLVDKDDSSKLRDLFVASSLKPILIGLALFFFQQMSGANAVSLYTVEVFASTGTTLDPNLASIIVAAGQFLTVVVSIFLVDRVGRKILLITSEIVMMLNLCVLGLYFYLKNTNADLNLSFLPLPAFLLFIIGYNIGMGPIPFLIISELLPSQSRALATAFVTSFYWIMSFVTAKTFEDLVKALGWTASYIMFAIICFLGMLFIYFMVPETKGKDNEEIELYFKRRSTLKRVSFRNSFNLESVTASGCSNSGFE